MNLTLGTIWYEMITDAYWGLGDVVIRDADRLPTKYFADSYAPTIQAIAEKHGENAGLEDCRKTARLLHRALKRPEHLKRGL